MKSEISRFKPIHPAEIAADWGKAGFSPAAIQTIQGMNLKKICDALNLSPSGKCRLSMLFSGSQIIILKNRPFVKRGETGFNFPIDRNDWPGIIKLLPAEFREMLAQIEF